MTLHPISTTPNTALDDFNRFGIRGTSGAATLASEEPRR
jgi:hypothetical protein